MGSDSISRAPLALGSQLVGDSPLQWPLILPWPYSPLSQRGVGGDFLPALSKRGEERLTGTTHVKSPQAPL